MNTTTNHGAPIPLPVLLPAPKLRPMSQWYCECGHMMGDHARGCRKCECKTFRVSRPGASDSGEPPPTVRYPTLPTASGTLVRISQAELERLGEYSMSIPTGVIIGKWWKRNINIYKPHTEPHWQACCFAPAPNTDEALIYFCQIELEPTL